MTTRVNRETVTFNKPFTLGEPDEEFPAGSYIIETEEELLDVLSRLAYRRTSTVMHVPERQAVPGLMRILTIDPNELEAAQKRDLAGVSVASE